jgi:hypothetical protein
MKIAAISAVILLGAATPALAQYAAAPPGPLPPYAPPQYAAAPAAGVVLPPYEMMKITRSMGFDPISRPVLRGSVYVIRALDEEGIAVRVAIDARSGNVLRVTESRPYARGGWRDEDTYMMPPETVPPGVAYPPPGDVERQSPSPLPPKVAMRTPLPRPAPPQTKPAKPALAALPDPKAIPGKSVPAPVANHASTGTTAAASTDGADQTTKSADHDAITGTTAPPTTCNVVTAPSAEELKLVPVAPLE